MAEVNGQVNLVRLGNIKLVVTLVLHEHSHKLVTDLGGMLSVLSKTELLRSHLLLEIFRLKVLAFDLFAPAKLIQTLSKEDCVYENSAIEPWVDLQRGFV